MSEAQNTKVKSGTSTVWQIVGRLVASAVVLAITAFFTPGFTINNIWTLAIAAIVFNCNRLLSSKIYRIACQSFW